MVPKATLPAIFTALPTYTSLTTTRCCTKLPPSLSVECSNIFFAQQQKQSVEHCSTAARQ
eukprot:3180596-Ditylum_brightwellii.AAC.1